MCNPDGATYTEQPCGATSSCVGGACVMQACTPGATRCVGAMVETCNPAGTAWTAATCPAMQGCQMGTCRVWTCTPGATSCASDTARGTCSADGFTLTPTPCATGERCVGGACVRQACMPGALFCDATGARMLCNADGTAALSMPCGGGQVCGGAGLCRLVGDACPGLDVTPDGPAVTLVPSGFSTSSELGVACGSGGPRTGFVDAVLHFRLTALRDVVVNVASGTTTMRMQLQSSCASGQGVVGTCATGVNPQRRYRDLAPGDYYVVLEYPSGSTPTPVSVSVTTVTPGTRLTGDACAAPYALTPDGPAVTMLTTGFDTVADVGTECGAGANGEGWTDWVARFTLAATRDVAITLTGGWAATTSTGARVALSSSCSRAGAVGGCYAIQGSTGRVLTYRALPPGTYFLVGESNNPTTSPVTALVTTADPNSRALGDACATAVVATVNGPAALVPVSPLDATTDVGTPCGSRGARVDGWRDWMWRFTLAAPSDLQLSVAALPSNSRFQVYTGCGAAATPVGPCLQSSSSYTRRYRGLAAGTYYVVAEAPSSSTPTTASLTVTTIPTTRLPGDTCVTALEVTPDGPPTLLTTTGFDTIADQGALCDSRGPQDGWIDGFWRFRIAAPRDVAVTFATTPSVAWRLQRGCGETSVPVAGCSNATAPERTRTFRDLPAGEYFIAMSGGTWSSASVSVTTAAPSARSPGDVCATAVVAMPDGPTVSVNTSLLSTNGDYGVTCGSTRLGTTTGYTDLVFAYTLTTTRDVTLELTPGASLAYQAEVHTSCDANDGPLLCTPPWSRERLVRLSRQPPGTYYVRVEARGSLGIMALRVTTAAPGTYPGYVVTRGALAASVDACMLPGATSVLTNVDDGASTRPVGFPFRLWGQMITGNVGISSNGFLTFDGTTPSGTTVSIPSPNTPNLVVAALARDLRTSGRGVCIATVGAAPNRQMYFQWANASYYSNGNPVTAQIVITETTHTIDFNYLLHSNAASDNTRSWP